MDETQLIEKVTALLGSYLSKAGDTFSVKVGEQASAAFGKAMSALWNKLKPTIESKEAAREAVEDLLDEPDDSVSQVVLHRQLKKLLKNDRTLAQELAGLVEGMVVTQYTATNYGDGPIAQDGGTAAGKGGAAIGGDNYAPVTINNHIQADDNQQSLSNSYLNCIMQQSGALSLDGIDPSAASDRDRSRLELHAIYTALLTQSIDHSRVKSSPSEAEEPLRGDKQQSAVEQLNKHRLLVLQGEPGGGKSTFVNFVTLCMAGALTKHSQVNIDRLTAPLPDRKGEDQEEKQSWSHQALLPLPIILRDFAATGLPDKGEATLQHLWDFIEQWLTKRMALAEYLPQLKTTLRDHGGLVLFDGLDEVPEANQRRQQVRQVIEQFAQAYSRCRILVTSRTYAYQNQDWCLDNFHEAVLAPLSNGQIIRFVDRWYSHISEPAQERMSPEDAAGKASLLKQAIATQPRIRELATRPLLLTLMASLHTWRGGSLPERREQLYADAVELLLNQWEVRRLEHDQDGKVSGLLQPSIAEWLKTDKAAVRGVLESLAYQAHSSQPELVGTADIDEGHLIKQLMDISNNPEANPARLIEYLRERSGLLVRRGDGVYTFPHRTFQEYLAACYLTGDDYPEQIADLARQAPDRWREVALLAGAKAVRGAASTIWSLADTLCHREANDTDARLEDAWGAHLAAQALVESADLSKVSKANQAKLSRIRDWLVALLAGDQLAAPERAIAGINLAQMGDPRFSIENHFLPNDPKFGFCHVPAGKFLMGSDEEKDIYANSDETPQHSLTLPEYYMARLPVTVAQFQSFIAHADYKPSDSNCLRGVSNFPVAYVTWHDALAYCRWLDDELRHMAEKALQSKPLESTALRLFYQAIVEKRLRVTLPSEAEWEKAARGIQGAIYPWDDVIDPERLNFDATGIGSLSSVGCFTKGESPYGCQEMAGNVLEWTRSHYNGYPYDTEDGREALESDERRVLRGGAFWDGNWLVRCAYRYRLNPGDRSSYFGFRVALSPFSER